MAGLAALSLGVACDGGSGGEDETPEPLTSFDTASAVVLTETDTLRITVELAEARVQLLYGLMERDSLPENHGMLFVYPEDQDSTMGFWMYRTRIPLDVAFLDADGQIVAIRSMKPCESPNPEVCRSYPAGVPFRSGLEMNEGFFERRGVQLGDYVRLLKQDSDEAAERSGRHGV